MKPRSFAPLFALSIAFTACSSPSSDEARPAPSASAVASAPTPRSSASAAPVAASASAAPKEAELPAFTSLVTSLSEPDSAFISDNLISNETSYLQVASALASSAAPGRAYIGVGPEQNFTYLALTRPSVAFIVDIRRQNMVQHILYRAAFEEATSRAHFIALVIGRAYEPEGDPGATGAINAVIAHAEKRAKDQAAFAAIHAKLRARAEKLVPLDKKDLTTFEKTHKAFFDKGLDLRFELREQNGRKYPTLRELFTQKDPAGAERGFLASEEAFRYVQTMEREGRVIPLVGDFAGEKALPGVAKYLTEHNLKVSVFYVSNVEQYLFEPGVWAKWSRNVAALPSDEKSLFLRAYLDQGKKHPKQMEGHRTATLLQRMVDFNERQAKKPFIDFWGVVNEKVL